MEDGRSHVGKDAVLHSRVAVLCHVDERDRVGGVGGVGRAVVVDGMVGVAVVGSDDDFIAIGLSHFHQLAQTQVDSLHCLLDGRVNSCVSHHVGVGEIHHNPVVAVGVDRLDETVFQLVGRHLGLEVVGGDRRRVHQDAVFAFERLFASSVDEGGDVGIFLGLGGMKLLQTFAGDVFSTFPLGKMTCMPVKESS